MKPGALDLPIIWRGCDYGPVVLKWLDRNGAGIDVSGWVPKAHSLNVDLKPIIVDAANGITKILLTRLETANLKLGLESWDWFWQFANNPTSYRFPPVLSGRVSIMQPKTPLNGQNGT